MTKIPAIFLDIDDSIIDNISYKEQPSDAKFYPFTPKASKLLQEYFILFFINNQSGIEKGLITKHETIEVNRYIVELLKAYYILDYANYILSIF